MARLDRLSPVKEVAQIGACIGREFSYELLSSIAPLSQAALGQALDELATSELIFRRGSPPEATYTFKHALVQDSAGRTPRPGRAPGLAGSASVPGIPIERATTQGREWHTQRQSAIPSALRWR